MVQLADRVKFSTNTTGQGTTIAVGSPESGYQSVPSSLDGKTLRIVIEEGNAWEISTAVYGHSSSNLTSRTLTSSSTGALLNLSGSAKVFISPSAEDIYPINTVLVTVSAGKFVVDGTSQQALSLMQSITYRFDQSDSTNSSHPLKFSTTSNGTHNSGSEYTTGVTVVGTAGSAGSYVEIKLEQDAPSTLYYYCGNHSGMGGSITVGAASSGIALTDLSVTQNAASGTGTLSYNNSSGVFSYTPPASTSSSGGTLEPVKETEFTASNNQTSFPVTYAVGNIAVFLNGSKLGAADFTATNGTSVVLATGATANDLVEVVEYGAPFAAPYKSSIYTANGSSPFNTGNTILTAAYTQGKEGVYVNGVKFLSGTDYTTNTGGTTITFTSALSTNDKVELVEHGALADAASAFTDLTDTPSSLGTAGQLVQVNSAGNALEFADAGSGTTTVATISALEALSAAEGDMAFVTGTNGLFIKKTAGWYKIATVANDQLQSVTVTMSGGGTSGNPYELALDGTDTTATGAATDPEGLSVTWSAAAISPTTLSGNNIVVSGTNVATLTQGTGSSSNVFTLDPVATTGTHNFSVRFSVTDGVNAALSTDKDYILNFVTVVANSRYTTMLAQAVGANNGTNSSLTDSSSNNATLTNTGTPVAGTFSPYRSGGYSWDFEGSGFFGSSDAGRGESIEAENNASAFNVGTNDYSLEAWFKSRSSPSNARLCDFGPYDKISLTHNNSNKVDVKENGTVILTSTSDVLDGDWHFVQVVRTGGYTKLYVDGTQEDSAASTTSIGAISKILVGAWGDYSYGFDGQVADFRFSNTARTAAVPTERLTSDSNTKLLVCSKPYLVDESGTATSLGVLKDSSNNRDYPNSVPLSPLDSEEYDAADNGGSIYADGSSGASFSQISLSATFTVECWFYMTASDNTWQTLFFSNSPFKHFVAKWTSSGIELQYYQNITHQTKTSLNTWNHAALVSDGTNIYVYLNGVRSTNSVAASQTFTTDYLAWRNSEELIGYIADARIIDGTAVYSGASFTPPSAPLSSSGADIHIKGTDASIIDKSGFANLTLAGDAKCVTTAVVHNSNTISPKSMYFDGTGDGVTLPNDLLTLSDAKSNFSMEMWAKFDNFNEHRLISSGTGSNFNIRGYTTYGNNRLMAQMQGSSICVPADVTANNLAANTWYHIALVRQTGSPYATIKTFINGAEYATETSWKTGYTIPSESKALGGVGSNELMQGYIQDFRFRPYYVGWVLNGSTYTYPVPTAPLEG